VDVPRGAGLRQLLHPEAVERDPSTSLILAETAEGSGLSLTACSASSTETREPVDAILHHPDIAAVSFVGSTPIARYIY
jgi:malonate-semialdehyde dehydrogenase (acetylating)/methylmalonate-semialdehyde dehydrogenase